MDEHSWKVNSKVNHSGLCPSCNDAVTDVDRESASIKSREVIFDNLDAIGEAGADNLRDNGIVTRKDVLEASDEEILDTAWIGEKGLKSIRQEVKS